MNNIKKRGQVTIFIILAIILVAAIALYFIFSSSVSTRAEIPETLEPVYLNFLSCAEEDIETGTNLLGSQGGYIELPEFESGSEYMPYSSQLNFLGNPIPYWYYISGNGVEKEQVPSISDMEKQLEEFIESRIRGCEFQEYYNQGFSVEMKNPEANVDIREDSVRVDLDMGMGIRRNNESVFVESHEVEINSNIGGLYESALDVYENQQNELFLEEYGIDILRSYAPVDGIEIQCSPLTWSADQVVNDLQEAIEVNTLALEENPQEYYNLDLNAGHEVRFLNSQSWPSTYEIAPNDGDFLVSNPIGNQPGLGALGFCYAPYHFTYNMRYPVLVQISEGNNQEEIFQFPMAVRIEGNQPREPSNAEAIQGPEVPLCEFKNTPMEIRVYDSDLDPIDARISYECFTQKCNIGQTEDGVLEEDFPQCVNGYVIADADGYEQGKYLFSSVNSGSLEVILDEIYDQNIRLMVDDLSSNKNAVITFTSNSRIDTVLYPEENIAELSEGSYNIEVQVYEDSEVTLGMKTTEQCLDVSSPGILGAFGFTQEECFDIEVPEQTISQVLIGGGSTEVYISEEDLSNSNTLEISVNSFDKPETIEDIQVNYILIDNSEVGVEFI